MTWEKLSALLKRFLWRSPEEPVRAEVTMAPKMAKETLIRSAAALAVLGCGVYFAFGVAAAVAAAQQGTAIHHDQPVSLALLWQEMSRISFKAVVAWLPRFGGVWLLVYLSVALTLASVALTLVVNPRLFRRSRQALLIPGVGFGMGSLFLFGFYGLVHFLFTLLNAFAGGGLDGEWVIETGPVFDAVGILYLIACLLLRHSLSFGITGRWEAS